MTAIAATIITTFTLQRNCSSSQQPFVIASLVQWNFSCEFANVLDLTL